MRLVFLVALYLVGFANGFIFGHEYQERHPTELKEKNNA